MNNCGVCNKDVPKDFTQLGRREEDGSITAYHMYCESQMKSIKPCEDCGLHRNFCNDCSDPIFDVMDS